jgi:hypothetical protein
MISYVKRLLFPVGLEQLPALDHHRSSWALLQEMRKDGLPWYLTILFFFGRLLGH